MSEQKDGGPAFPGQQDHCNGNMKPCGHKGKTISSYSVEIGLLVEAVDEGDYAMVVVKESLGEHGPWCDRIMYPAQARLLGIVLGQMADTCDEVNNE